MEHLVIFIPCPLGDKCKELDNYIMGNKYNEDHFEKFVHRCQFSLKNCPFKNHKNFLHLCSETKCLEDTTTFQEHINNFYHLCHKNCHQKDILHNIIFSHSKPIVSCDTCGELCYNYDILSCTHNKCSNCKKKQCSLCQIIQKEKCGTCGEENSEYILKECRHFQCLRCFGEEEKCELCIKKNGNCPICLNSIKDKIILACSHTFCSPCILKWEKYNNKCPICRKSEDDIIKETNKLLSHPIPLPDLYESE